MAQSPAAWACLIALVIEQEPLVGDRQFWTTRPYRRGTMLAAKALFLLVFVHGPFFVANTYVLAARGFSPLAHLPELLWQQLLLAAALTLPAAALASLVRNFTHFILELVAVAAVMIFLTGALDNYPRPPWQPIDAVRGGIVIVVAGAAALAIIWIQYTNRRPLLARGLGVASGALAAGLFAGLLPQSAFAVRSAIKPARADLAMRVATRTEQPPPWLATRENRVTVAIPIEISGIPDAQSFRIESLAAQTIGPSGDRYRAEVRSARRTDPLPVFEAYLWPSDSGQSDRQWVILSFDRQTYDRIPTGRVRLSGQAGVTFYRLGETTWMPVGAHQPAVAVGLCTTSMVEDPWSGEMLKVECESVSRPPLGTRVRLWHPETGSEWHQRFGFGYTFYPGPRTTWLSPLDRRQCYFRIARPSQNVRPDDRFTVPAAAVATGKLAITPEHLTGYAMLRYDLPELLLKDYVLQPPAPR